MTTKPHAKPRTLVEGALLIALGTVLSYIPIFELPHGGSVTFVSTLPIILMSLRHGPKWGLFTAFVYSLIQLFLGLKNLTYCQTLGAQVGCALLDYVLSYTVLGLAWYIAKPFPSTRAGRATGIGISIFAVSVLRYVCNTLSGYVVWKDYDYAFEWMTNFGWGQAIANMGENALCWLYSAVYNATFMLPETLVTVAAAVVLALAAPRLFNSRAKL